ncbi:MAG: hypothetical protein RL226_1401 [Bacteroidota bacterium]
MNFLPLLIEKYTEEHCSEEPALLRELSIETHRKVLMPRMLSGHVQGRILSLLSKMMRPRRVLEIGAYTGYSAMCFAEGLVEGGAIDTIEINDELNSMQDTFWTRAGIRDQINRFNAPALEVLPTLTQEYDIIFLDADKRNYLNYYEDCVRLLRPGGILLVDNVLWSGKVVEDVLEKDVDTQVIKAINARMQEDPRLFNVLLPVRDGIHIGMKL